MRHVHLRAIVVLVAAFVLVRPGAPPQAQGGAVSLERLLSAPFPTGLVAAPARGAVAWVFNDRGVRNIWVAEAPDYRGRRLTSYTTDAGQDLGGLEWTSDGPAIVYVHGGPANRQNEVPNPTSDPKGAEQTIWIAPLDGGGPRKLADGSSPRMSPQGDRVAYLVRGQVWSVGIQPDAKPSQLIKARGSAGSLKWSPDGSRLALASGRGDHSFIGVYDVASASLRFLDPSVDRDNEPAWSPDGRRVAFVRIPAAPYFFSFGPRRERPSRGRSASPMPRAEKVVRRGRPWPGTAACFSRSRRRGRSCGPTATGSCSPWSGKAGSISMRFRRRAGRQRC